MVNFISYRCFNVDLFNLTLKYRKTTKWKILIILCLVVRLNTQQLPRASIK